jgi:hypothetical protein
MRVRDVLREMSAADAAAIFAKYGVPNAASLPSDDLKVQRRKLMMQHHQDRTGDKVAGQEINAAYDILSRKPTISRTRPSDTGASASSSRGGDYDWSHGGYYKREEPRGDPRAENPWAWAGYSGGAPPSTNIYRQDFTDYNFIKKYIWELTQKMGAKPEEYTIWGFDGTFFRNSITVYGSPETFKTMAHAMFDWQTKGGNPYQCRAIFVSPRKDPHLLYLVYADDHIFDDPLVLHHESMNSNPGNDQAFQRRLPGYLDRLMADMDQQGQ